MAIRRELRIIEGFKLCWARAENERVWEFLKQHWLPTEVKE